jgi:hypothetical protein
MLNVIHCSNIHNTFIAPTSTARRTAPNAPSKHQHKPQTTTSYELFAQTTNDKRKTLFAQPLQQQAMNSQKL